MSDEGVKKVCDKLGWIAVWCFFIMLNTCGNNKDTLNHVSETNDKILKALQERAK